MLTRLGLFSRVRFLWLRIRLVFELRILLLLVLLISGRLLLLGIRRLGSLLVMLLLGSVVVLVNIVMSRRFGVRWRNLGRRLVLLLMFTLWLLSLSGHRTTLLVFVKGLSGENRLLVLRRFGLLGSRFVENRMLLITLMLVVLRRLILICGNGMMGLRRSRIL